MKIYKITFLFIALFSFQAQAQNPTPGKEQSKRILLTGGAAHLGNGEVIPNSAIGFEKGKLKLVADATTIRIDKSAYDTVIDISGKHVYPGLIALNTIIGLSEIEAVRATNDFNETGSYNPSVRSVIAYNTDSRVIPTIRSNGVLLAQIVPRGGVVSGQSSVVELDGWNYEDAVYKTDDGIHLNWPSMRIVRTRRSDSDDKQKERMDKTISEIRKLFSDAKAYASEKQPVVNQHLEAMRGLFNGSKILYVHCNYVKEIIAAVGFSKEFGLKMVLVGGNDSHMVTDLLRQNNIPVVLMESHRLPSREDEDLDMPFKLASILEKAGVPYALAVKDFWQVRNLAFQAGQTAGHGLTPEQALKAVTASPAKILGIDQTTGTLETGKDATLLIVGGDLLDMRTSKVEFAYIRGKEVDLNDQHKMLNEKFSRKYQE